MLGIFQQPPLSGKMEPLDKLDPKLLLLNPRPRIVKMGWPIKVQIAIGILFFAMFLAWFNETISNIKTAVALQLTVPGFILLCLVVVASALIINALRELRLLRYGNCVMGRVVDQVKSYGGRRRRMLIVYQFAVGPGKPMTATGNDYTKSYRINSQVLVFFDPDRLERHVAICSTGWRVHDETGRLIEP